MATNLIFNLFGRDLSASKTLRKIGLLAGDTSDRIKKFGDDSTKALSKFTKAMAIGSAVASATVAVQGLSGVAGALAGAVAAASGALLLLPGAALAAGVAFGALKIATSGFGEALKSSGDPKKFAEALKKLTPAAQEAAKAIRDLKAPFDELRKSLQEKLFAKLGPQISDVGNKLITTLRPAFESVATSANTAISGVLTELSSVQSQLQIGLLARNAATAFGNLAAAARPVVAALLDIGTVGASFLPGLTAGAGAAAQRFADMIARMRESGQLGSIIQGGLDALRQLGQLLANVGGIIGTVFSAMQSAGGGTLGILVQLTGEARAFLNSASGQQVLTTIFTTLHDLVQALLPGVRALGGALVSAITSIAPALPGVGEAFSAVAQSVAPLVETLGSLVGTILPPLAATLGFLAPAIGPLAGFIGAVVVATKLWSAAQLLLNIAMAANPIGIVIVALGALVAAVALVIAHWDAIKAATSAAWEWIKGAVSAGVSAVLSFVRANWPLLLGIIGGPIGLIVGLVIKNWDAIKGLISEAWNAIRSTAVGAWNSIVGAVSAGADRLLGLVRGIPGRILGALGNLGGLLYNAGRNVIQGLINGIMAMVGAVGRAIGSVASKIRAALPFSPAKEGPLSGRGSPHIAGRTVVEMLAGGLLARQSVLQGAMSRIAGSMALSGGAGALGSGAGYDHVLEPYIASQRRQQAAQVQISSGGSRLDDLLVELLRKAIKDQGGGNVQTYLGR